MNLVILNLCLMENLLKCQWSSALEMIEALLGFIQENCACDDSAKDLGVQSPGTRFALSN